MTKTPVGYPQGGKKYKGPADNVGQDPRADTSLAKQQMSNEVKVYSDRMKRKDVKTLKGPRR